MPRHAEYNRDAVVAQATAVFWQRGYGQTSISDLVAATGLQPGSLYAAFGNKKGLFLEVVDRYNQAFIGKIHGLRRADGSALAKIRGLLQQIVDDAIRGKAGRGCLSVNTLLEMAQHDADIADRLTAYNAQVRKALAWLVKDAQTQGDIAADTDANELATFVVNNIWGLRVMCKSRPDRASLDAIVTGVMAGLKGRG
ncbi:MAG: TetR/AcrR family transcriptional regulator [Gammaproteobacteria bacterium]|nr:TetR/AcrR family transcriptional regulator [Gammaproteobacteria bacterium]MDH5617337.1 TetR/AcrR family transcriptional regulator [Gammaproteobacteria bacterium]